MGDLLNKMDTDWTQRNMPPGQGSKARAESTIIGENGDSEEEGSKEDSKSEKEDDKNINLLTLIIPTNTGYIQVCTIFPYISQ